MIVSIHQPEHLPWLGFFDKMRQADIFVLLDSTQYAKDDFQNRNKIKTERGPSWITVPVYKKGKSEQLIMDVEISYDSKWQNKAWQLILQSYKEAPYFAEHRSYFEDLYKTKYKSLAELNINIINYLAQQLGLTCKIITASELNIFEKGSTTVNLKICESLGADTYISGKMGKQYLDESRFEDSGITIKYQDFNHPTYRQLWGEFTPYMSVIDLLFNHGSSSLNIIADANAHVSQKTADLNEI
jgi:hypothetical protein